MDIEKVEPTSFTEYVAAAYVDHLLCPEADTVRTFAVKALRGALKRHDVNGNKIWLSKGGTTKKVKGVDINFRLAAPRTTFRRPGTDAGTISLIANNDYTTPAALILPAPDSEGACASVVVSGVINDPGI